MSRAIGFIGLGIMGRPMAKNLLATGYELIVLDVDRSAVDELVACGAAAATTPAEVASRAQRIITMLPDGPDVEQVVCGDSGILETATGETVLIDMSSISPTVTRRISAALETKGARCLDAPVSGGEPAAVSGQLAIMVGGPEQLFGEVRPIFDALGASAVLVGGIGSGQVAKLANQLLVAAHLEAMGEALLLAVKAGVDPLKVIAAISGGLAGSNVLNAKALKLLDGDFTPGFKIRLHQKDLKNVLEAAQALELSLPFAEMVKGMLDTLVAEGKGEQDHAGIAQVLEAMNGCAIRLTDDQRARQSEDVKGA